jgi:hypothetical protein
VLFDYEVLMSGVYKRGGAIHWGGDNIYLSYALVST